MKQASQLYSSQQCDAVEQAVKDAESKTSCEIVPVIATSSGRYDRAEDIVGLLFAVIAAATFWLLFPRATADVTGSWDRLPTWFLVLTLAGNVIVAFILGAWLATSWSSLRRLFTSVTEMKAEVQRAAQRMFFDHRVHHTAGASGLLFYVSLYEHQVMVLGDEAVTNAMGQPFLDELVAQLSSQLKTVDAPSALQEVIRSAGEQLSAKLPRSEDDVNELPDPLVLVDEG